MKQCLLFFFAMLLITAVHAQSRQIQGRVTNSENGETMTGVSVKVKGGNQGTSTGADGRFSINVPGNESVLIFSFVGFKEVEVAVGKQVELAINLSTDSKAMENVVVIGYGTQKKRAVTGAVVSVGYDEFKDRSFSNVAQSLAGTVPGVQIASSQGAPGFGPTIKIRGNSSITAGTTPLYVVDGMALENFDLNQINPQDIQSVEILKDAASSAIYGSRGANGVIIVTTKLGKAGKTQVNVAYEQGISKVTRKVDMMDAQEWIKYYIDARNNAWVLLDPVNNKPTDDNAKRSLVSGAKNYMIPDDFLTNPAQFGKGTDWQDVMYQTAPMSNAQVSLNGGTDKTSYLFSVGYLDQKAVLIENFYKRLSLRSNIRQKISDRVTAGLNIAFTGTNDRTDGTSGKSDVVSLGLQSDPIFPEYNENGYLGFLDPNSTWKRFQTFGVQLWSPHSLISYADKLNKTYNTLANAYLEVKPIKDLTLRASGNGNVTNTNNNWYWEAGQGYGYSSVLPAQASVKTTSNLNWLAEFTATYNKTFGDHTLGAVAGYSSQKNRFENTAINGTDFPNDLVRTINAAGTITKPANANFAEEWSLLSMLGRVSYGFKNRYFMNATLRRDGSSRFGEDSKWGTFPSVSAAWLVSDEGFMRNMAAINTLKLRVSYGQTGNNLIPNYGSISLLGTSRYVNGTSVVNGLRTISISNPGLKWEKTGQYNIGADLALLKNRINITIDAYKSVTKDMLLNVPVPAYTGFTTQLTNIGSMENKGFEFGLSTKNIDGGAFTWSTDFNLSINRNKVLKLGPNNAPIEIDEWGYFVTEVGQPISNYKGYIFDGIYNNQSEVDKSIHYAGAAPGDPIIRDVNGDKKIDINDRTILGNIQPDFTAGLTNTLRYKGFEFSFMLQGVFGSEIWNQQTRFSKFWNDSRNSYASVTNYWKSEQEPGDGKTFKPYATYSANAQGKAAFIQGYSNYWMEDGTFVRIKNLRASYSLPNSVLKKTPIKNVRVYANAENVYVFSDYVGYDPENSTYSVGTSSVPGANGGNSSNPPGLLLGADYGAYPIPLIVTFGVKMDF
ncbi:TonB-dependent receptor [Chitinophagaceae bacterium LB-8]|uniref:TonB-dependent receptor n=1 Tax=Paraflavisolibacter caeni TaxID=2982496 RepID=A0A9X2XWZ4_9BACT|nr:TonB-dependent receptor [Paraflavisolibacter caeni]MCU7550605.1 TonB-dependent receptor [Paraflavisolibacter caeni]